MTEAVLEQSDTQAVVEQALTWPQRAKALIITDSPTYVQAGDFLKGIKSLRKEIDAAFDPIITKAHAAHKEAVSQKQRAEAPLAEAERILKGGLIAWDTEQERIRREEERRLQEEARKQEEQRRMDEAAALEAQAVETGDSQMMAEAQELIAAPVVAPVVIVPKSTPVVSGISYREVWKFRVVNAGLVPDAYKVIDEVKIGGVVRAMKGNTQIPGIQVYAEKVASAGAR